MISQLDTSAAGGLHKGNTLADAAVELPALLLDALDAGDRLHTAVIHSADFRDPVHAGGMAPQPCLRGGLQGAPLNGAQAALGRLAVILQASHTLERGKQQTCTVCLLGYERDAKGPRTSGCAFLQVHALCLVDRQLWEHLEMMLSAHGYNEMAASAMHACG